MPNRLANESSPYLLQHRDNPVDWYPWSQEAIQKARRDEKPIFLSIGYSACHWCHVMEHESFENEAIARVLNENFVSIKVDREERPDLDQIYMNAVQMLTGHGGWPMSVFLTPDLKPFYGGTYWPPQSSRGMPGFDQILAAVIDAWRNRREHALTAADQLTAELRNVGDVAGGDAGSLNARLIDRAVIQLHRAFDNAYGGFGSAPKFPHSMDLQLLVRVAQRTGQQAPLDMVR
ncbi:MAG TPA: thioredoxin domain-containing protein, partial [Lacipirellulaceae bacterium]